MDKLKAVVNDPAKLEEELKKAFEKMDADKKQMDADKNRSLIKR